MAKSEVGAGLRKVLLLTFHYQLKLPGASPGATSPMAALRGKNGFHTNQHENYPTTANTTSASAFKPLWVLRNAKEMLI